MADVGFTKVRGAERFTLADVVGADIALGVISINWVDTAFTVNDSGPLAEEVRSLAKYIRENGITARA